MKSVFFLLLAGLSCAGALADDGRLYGTVEMRDGRTLTGAIRWDGEEVFWTDHFNGTKAEPADLSDLDEDDRERILDHQPGPTVDFNGRTVEFIKLFGSDELQPQEFRVEFGSIRSVIPGEDDRVTLELRDGVRIEGDGGSNDIGADIEVRVDDGSESEVDWDDIKSIRFALPAEGSTPKRFEPHLYGTVESESGTFTGAIQWDQDERYWSERLDAEVDGDELAVEFGQIQEIHRLDDASRVVTKDGVSRDLGGTNDVDDSNRGLYIDTVEIGRIDLPWERFVSVRFMDEQTDGLSLIDRFEPMPALTGQVETTDGETLSGAIRYDVDESSRAEMISGTDNDGVGYEIPLRLVASVRPAENRAIVTLRSGRTLDLGNDRDVSHKNNGLVVGNDAGVHYVAWEDLREVRFD